MSKMIFLISVFAVIVHAEFPPKFEVSSVTDIPSGHLKPFGYHRPPDGPVVEEEGFLHPSAFWKKYVSIHRPMVFRQAVAESPALDKWSDEYLAKEYGDLELLLEVKRENRSNRPTRVNISTFVDIYTKEDVYAVTLLPDAMRKDIQVPTCLLCGTFRDFVHETNFWMSSGGTRSVIHFDADENIHCIVNGSKDFIMIDNRFESFLYMAEKMRFSGSGYSRLDPDSLDILKHPEVVNIQWTYTTLYPGDCIYIPSKYIHLVRSYKRTISATILFTSSVERTYNSKGCEDNDFHFTPLSDIDVHWTYKKGDITIDMGYINVELLRRNILEIFDEVESDFVTFKEFAQFLESIEGDEELAYEELEELFSVVFGKGVDGRVSRKDVHNLPRESLKLLARNIDDPHGPLKEPEGANMTTLSHTPEKDEL